MTAARAQPEPPREPAAFGAGGAHPYDRALRADGDGSLVLEVLAGAGAPSEVPSATDDAPRSARIDVAAFLADGDEVDHRVVGGLRGPVLDVGCGPDRLVRCAILAGHLALGVDVSRTAVDVARDRGLPVLRRSVFERLPLEGEWRAVLLIDGNIGIGGAPAPLLARCAALAHPAGEIVVETRPDAIRDRAFDAVVTDGRGLRSGVFPWAEVGVAALASHAARANLRVRETWSGGGRTFATVSR